MSHFFSLTALAQRLRCTLAIALPAALLSAALPWAATASESTYAARNGFAFALLGNIPASPREEETLAHVLDQVGKEADLAIHVGSIKGENERCEDKLYEQRRALLIQSPVPLILTPGDNDWADCDREAAGQYGPVERLNRLRDLFFDGPQSLGRLRLDLHRQSETVRYRGYPENARWEYGKVMFATFNTPGNQNNFRAGAGRNGEYEDRIQANAFWLRQVFAAAVRSKAKGIVLAFHADPRFQGKHDVAPDGRDPYADLKSNLTKLASKYSGPVLVMHGSNDSGTGLQKPDHPLRLKGKTLQNVTRIRAYGSPRPQYWVKVSVDGSKKGGSTELFHIETLNTVLAPPQP